MTQPGPFPLVVDRLILLSLIAAMGALLSAAVQAEPEKHRTDWFRKAGCGVFVHYLNGLQNNRDQLHSLGRETTWDECVAEFDTERFADAMQEVGAGYVIFTIMQGTSHLIAPNRAFDRITGYKPGEACARRDLVLDLHRSLSKRNIPLMLYYTGDGPRVDPKAAQAFGWRQPVTPAFVRKWALVVQEYGLRYRDKVKGYWVDGMYPFIGYDDSRLATMAQALRAGYPDRIIALNRGVDPTVMSYTRHEDFTAGEQNRFYDVPRERWIDNEQWHILSYLSPTSWAQPGCAYAKEELADYVASVHSRGGVVSIEAMLFRDGSLDRSQMELIKAATREVRQGKPREPVPPGNLAYRKQSRILSLDGSHPLIPNSGRHFARYGVDGRPDTLAQGAEEWPWTYEVDLVDTVPVRRVRLTFGPTYATRFEIRLSTDGQAWTVAAARDGHDGTPFDQTFEPTPARYVRVCALKPDGPDQPGGQMAVAELEVYR